MNQIIERKLSKQNLELSKQFCPPLICNSVLLKLVVARAMGSLY